jgi:hypothetical protein
MREGIKQQENTSSAEFEEGVEAGRNSTEDTHSWKARNELGQKLKREGDTEEPLFLRDSPEGNRGDAQDEKDETEE